MAEYNRLAEDLNTYLNAKLPDVAESTKMELSEYISNRLFRFLQDALWERDEEWRRAMKAEYRKHTRNPYRVQNNDAAKANEFTMAGFDCETVKNLQEAQNKTGLAADVLISFYRQFGRIPD